jgi:hypothetical protein
MACKLKKKKKCRQPDGDQRIYTLRRAEGHQGNLPGRNVDLNRRIKAGQKRKNPAHSICGIL